MLWDIKALPNFMNKRSQFINVNNSHKGAYSRNFFTLLWPISKHVINGRLLRCWGQLEGLVPAYTWEVPLRLNACKSFSSLKVPLKLKIKDTWSILSSHFILSHFAQMHYTVAKCQSTFSSFRMERSLEKFVCFL